MIKEKRNCIKNCPMCGTKTISADSRPMKDGIRRRRICPSCGHRFTTYEVVEDDYLNVKNAKKIMTQTRSLLKATLGMLDSIIEEEKDERTEI